MKNLSERMSMEADIQLDRVINSMSYSILHIRYRTF